MLRIDEDGREILLYYIKQGESCIMSFLGGIHQDTSKVKAIAEEDSKIFIYSYSCHWYVVKRISRVVGIYIFSIS